LSKRIRLLILCSIISAFQIWSFEVSALPKDRLNIRQTPTLQGQVIAKVPHGALMELLSRSETSTTVDGLTDNWCKVKLDESEGWVFCAYVGRYYRNTECSNFMPDKKQIVKTSEKRYPPTADSVGGAGKNVTITTYKNGIISTKAEIYEGFIVKTFLPDGNLYEAYLIAQKCQAFYAEIQWPKPQMINKTLEFRVHDKGMLKLIKTTKGVEIFVGNGA
jgi:hypothetical protein